MASIPYLIVSPTAILSLIALSAGPDKTVPTPSENWQDAIVDILIPAKNEEENIVFALASIIPQTIKPRRIVLIDDASTDKTAEYARDFCKSANLELTIIEREYSQGKTPSLKYEAEFGDADVLCVLDADTVLRSENYLETLVRELYQGVGIACACGVIMPFERKDRERLLTLPVVKSFSDANAAMRRRLNLTKIQRLLQTLTDWYREELYLFLQKFIYHGEMVYCGSIINPVGCAVAYRRKYLKAVFDQFHRSLNGNLSTSEDIFIGFTFANYGYRNIQVNSVYALTQEPPINKLPKQIFLWSSSFLQCSYYYGDLLFTPFKLFSVAKKWIWEKTSKEFKKIMKKRKIQEAYRQAFGDQLTIKYGRPIGWFVFLAAFEKTTFPFAFLMMIILKMWEFLFITFSLEVLLFSTLIAIFHRNKKILNFFRSILLSPIRYSVLMYDLYILLYFYKDLIFYKSRKWKK